MRVSPDYRRLTVGGRGDVRWLTFSPTSKPRIVGLLTFAIKRAGISKPERSRPDQIRRAVA